MRSALKLAVAALAVLVLAGCDRMSDQPKQLPYEYYPGERASNPDQIPPPGTLSRDEETSAPAPPPVSLALLKRGQQRYGIYCSPCHGRVGDGHGMVEERGFPAPPSYFIPRLLNAPSQHFYDVITNGYGVMYSYADRIAPSDRWAIIAYIRALQASQHATLGDVPVSERGKLK